MLIYYSKQYDNLQLGWRSSLTKERIAMLEKLDFSWDARVAAWDLNMKDLLHFKERKGHVHVPWSKTGNTPLSLWVRELRRHHARLQRGEPSSHLTPIRVQQLNGVGFCWDTQEASWQECYHELIAYKQQYHNCNVPADWPDNPKLSAWVHVQRRDLKRYMDGERSNMTEKHLAALREIGFNWKLGSIKRASKTEPPPSTSLQFKKRKSGIVAGRRQE
jgi:Helicase associated domain